MFAECLLNVWRMSGMYIQPCKCVWSYLNVCRMSVECLECTFSLVNVYGAIGFLIGFHFVWRIELCLLRMSVANVSASSYFEYRLNLYSSS